ncbi:MAG: pantetheine-phosphate adenylyltransferase [Anaerolineae bacterium]|nr:pantetheine-phosphate adenylyltransferase [Anaerolineae bacterium]MCO5190752.1 pantetheine-phosphate adenylyltransferase [Anaerolineae bacterium]MCO5197780.1 pantetheine-phosphate adenylyltransferase [Anaerolineae bacterium]MCO5207319.1 pantetheine-phosphate adenylyltransferase [Anaerolineae bacterium]
MNIRAVYPGTFDPIHNGHIDIIKRAAEIFSELTVAVYDHGRPIKSVLFSVEERVEMIESVVGNRPNITILSYGGLTVDLARKINAKVIVRGLRVFSDFEFEFRMALANQRLAPEVEVVTLIAREQNTFLSGSTVREIASFHGDVSSMVPPNIAAALANKFNGEQEQAFSAPISLRD